MPQQNAFMGFKFKSACMGVRMNDRITISRKRHGEISQEKRFQLEKNLSNNGAVYACPVPVF